MTQKRPRSTKSERKDIVDRWQQSGRPAREFAEQTGVKASSLYLWRKQLRAAAKGESKARDSKPAFSELRLSNAPAATGHVEIVARNGRIVRVHGSVDARALQQALMAVEQC